MIDRRIFLQLTSGTAAAGAVGVSTRAVAGAHTAAAAHAAPLLVQVSDGVASPLADRLRILSERLALATEGRLSLTALPATGSAAPSAEALVLACEEDYGDSEPTSLLLGGLPLGGRLGEFDIATWLMGAGGQAVWDAAAARHGWKPLMIGEVGGDRTQVWSRSRLVTSSDFRGLRIAGPRVMHSALAGFGARPVSLTGFEALSALEAGEIDAFETDDPSVSLAAAYRLPRDAHWYVDSLSGRSGVISLRMPLEHWHRLSVRDQTIFQAVAAETAATLRAIHRAHHVPLVRQLRALRGTRPGLFFIAQGLLGIKAREALDSATFEDPLFASAFASMSALKAGSAEPTDVLRARSSV